MTYQMSLEKWKQLLVEAKSTGRFPIKTCFLKFKREMLEWKVSFIVDVSYPIVPYCKELFSPGSS